MSRPGEVPAVTLRPMTDADRDAMLRLRLAPGQERYVSPIDQILEDRLPAEDFHLIVEAASVVGSFSIDRDYARRHDFCLPDELGLLGFQVDGRQQGRGIGHAACARLGAYLSHHYPDRSSVVLTVNCRNVAAQRLYLSSGFEDTGELYHGGRSGPQHIYRMPIMQNLPMNEVAR